MTKDTHNLFNWIWHILFVLLLIDMVHYNIFLPLFPDPSPVIRHLDQIGTLVCSGIVFLYLTIVLGKKANLPPTV